MMSKLGRWAVAAVIGFTVPIGGAGCRSDTVLLQGDGHGDEEGFVGVRGGGTLHLKDDRGCGWVLVMINKWPMGDPSWTLSTANKSGRRDTPVFAGDGGSYPYVAEWRCEPGAGWRMVHEKY